MKRLLLLKPYRPDRLFVATPPLGLLSVASYTRQKHAERGEDLDIRILDLNPDRRLPEQAMEEIAAYQPDVIGMSALSCEADAVHAMSRLLKQRWPDTPVILGGPFPSHDREQALRDECIDYHVLGEGEETFDHLLQVLAKDGDPADVPGLAFRRDDGDVVTPERPFLPDLDALPLPAYDLLEFADYFNVPRHSRVFAHHEYMTVVSTRGCPYKCIYCHVTMGKKTRFRSATKVVDEIEYLVRNHGIKEIHWSDDIWNLNKRRSKEICDQIIARGLKVAMAFPNGVRGDLIDDELLDKMKAAGTYHMTFAPESGSPRVQKFIEKYAKLDILKSVIQRASERGIWCHGFFMVGFPTETLDEMQMTFDYALQSRLNTASFFIVNAHRGTRLYEIAEELGLHVDFKSAAHNYMNAEFQLSSVPTPEVRRRIGRTYLRFFLSPTRLWRIFRTVPRKRQLLEFAVELWERVLSQRRERNDDIYQAEGVPPFPDSDKLQPVVPYNRL